MIADLGRKWRRNPEPGFPEKNPNVILDCNIDGQAWLYDATNEGEAYLVFDGQPSDVVP